MDINTLKAMLERRGYNRETVTSDVRKQQIGAVLFAVEHGRVIGDIFTVESVQEVAWTIDRELGGWQHHVWCSQCHEPLLQGGIEQPDERIEALLGVSEQEIAAMKKRASGFAYRSAKAGPYSTPLVECPGCHCVLGFETVEEIVD